ncbi:hypothetical protein [Seinonella peptonophila]|uniref:hypothetical protein n=1 Tax=Seinonella peptonophila TaxID=112248 RepID=UPI0015874716|nr:hypothetical protein [Seinonella peptonophila]
MDFKVRFLNGSLETTLKLLDVTFLDIPLAPVACWQVHQDRGFAVNGYRAR